MLVRARHSDLVRRRTLWDRRALATEFSFEMRRDRRLNVRYEADDMIPAGSPAALRAHVLKAEAFGEAWGGRLSLAPVLDLVARKGASGAPAATALRAAISVKIVPPHWFPGTDWVIRWAASRTPAAGHGPHTLTDLVFRWSLKR